MKDIKEKTAVFLNDLLYKHLKIDQIRDYVMRLSDRDRQIVIAGSALICLFLLLFVYYLIDLSLDRKEAQVNDFSSSSKRMKILRDEYNSSFIILKQIENTIKNTPADFSLASRLEKIAESRSIKIDSIGPPRNPTKPNDYYTESQVEVKVKMIDLETLKEFLFEIENSKEFLKITSLRIRHNYTDPVYLDVTFSVSTFSPK